MISAPNSFPRQMKARSGIVAATKRRKWATVMKIPRKSSKVFICKLCGIEKSSSIVRHYIHLRSHGLRTISRARYRCSSCLFYFTSPAWLKFHKSKEKRDLVKKRKLRWKLPYLAATPLKVHHSKFGGRKVSSGRGVRGTKCEECDEYDGPELEQHLESVHGLVSPFQCRYCHFSIRFYSQYKLHRKMAHKSGGRKNGRGSPKKITTTKCSECSEYDGPNLLEHLEQVHHLTRPFQCSSCPFSTGAYSLFKIHRSTHRHRVHGQWRFLKKCRECDDYDGPELINHLAQAHGMTKPFQCSGCPKVFSAYSRLLNHRKAHGPKEARQKLGMGIKYELKMGIKCEECEEYEGRQVYSHLKAVHGLPRPFKCPHCQYSTEFYTNFKSHRASHLPAEDHEAKPVRRITKCGECNDYEGSEFYSHLSEVHNLLKPFKCPKCSFKCQYYSPFKLHRDRCNRSAAESTRNNVDIPLTNRPYHLTNRQDVIRCGECKEHDGLNVYEHLQNIHSMSRPFKCSECNYITDFYTNFKIHQGLHWPEKIQEKKGWNKLWKCKECDEYDGPELYAHLLDAHGMEKPLKCSLCDKVVNFYSHLLVHRSSHTKEPTKCEECDEYEGADLKVHLKDQHGMTPPYNCIHCKSQHTNYSSLVKHRKSHKKEMIKCEECQDYEGLDIYGHLETTHGMSPPFSCSLCPEKFMTYTRLKRHHDVRRSKGGRCGECDAQVDTDLASHLESVHQLKSPFHCSMCKFTHKFYSIYKLHREKRHGSTGNKMIEAQVGRKATKCRECNAYDGPNLMNHLESVHGLKIPFKCPDCVFTGNYYSRFTEHRKSHFRGGQGQGQGQHECSICGARYEFLGHLTTHMNRHQRQAEPKVQLEQPKASIEQRNKALTDQPNKSGMEQPNECAMEQPIKALMDQPYTCPFCETNMIKLDLFKLHVLNHCQNEPQNPLKCHICEGFFPTTKAFLEHVTDHHDPTAVQMDPQTINMDMTNGKEFHKESLRTFQDSSQGPYSPEVSLTENDSIYEPLNSSEPQVNPFEMDYNSGVGDFDVDEEEEEDEQEIIGCQDCGQLFYTEESYLVHTTKHRVPFVTLTRAFRCQDKPIYV